VYFNVPARATCSTCSNHCASEKLAVGLQNGNNWLKIVSIAAAGHERCHISGVPLYAMRTITVLGLSERRACCEYSASQEPPPPPGLPRCSEPPQIDLTLGLCYRYCLAQLLK
jgi:hypothetical protein